MSIKTIIVNDGCSAKCFHCPYGSYPSKITLLAHEEICSATEDIILISGGEPLELKAVELYSLIINCLNNQKIFRIATGGHISLESIAKKLMQIPYFSGFSIGTDVLLKERNKRCHEFKKVWEQNIALLNELQTNYSFTLTLSQTIHFELFLPIIQSGNPDFVMINSVDKSSTVKTEICKHILEEMGYTVKYGYLA